MPELDSERSIRLWLKSPFNPNEPPTRNIRKKLSRWEYFRKWARWYFNLEG